MLTDVILEEDFEKNREVWYDRRDLEHGNVSDSGLQSHPKLWRCPGVVVMVTNIVTFMLKKRARSCVRCCFRLELKCLLTYSVSCIN